MITINDKWRIRTDPLNYIPEIWQESKPITAGKYMGQQSEAKYVSIGRYYGTLEQALQGILRYEMAEIGAKDVDVEQFLAELRQIMLELKQ